MMKQSLGTRLAYCMGPCLLMSFYPGLNLTSGQGHAQYIDLRGNREQTFSKS